MNDKHTQDLQQAFGFNELDLQANRSGLMTPRQIEMLKGITANARMSMIIPTIVGFFAFVVPTSLVRDIGLRNVIAIVLFVLFLVGLSWLAARYTPFINHGLLATTNGKITILPPNKLRVGNIDFRINPLQSSILSDQCVYSLYYMSGSKIILSLETVAIDSLSGDQRA